MWNFGGRSELDVYSLLRLPYGSLFDMEISILILFSVNAERDPPPYCHMILCSLYDAKGPF